MPTTKVSLKWSNSIGSRNRQAWLLLVGQGDQIVAFDGATIKDKVVVVSSHYEKAGKWSHTTFQLELAPGVSAHAYKDGWEEGTFREALNAPRWVDAANRLGVSLPVMQAFLRDWWPKAAEHYDRVEAELASLDDIAPQGAAQIIVTFGAPTRRARENGYWDWPVLILDKDGALVAELPAPTYQPPVGSPVRLLDMKQSSGHGGGYTTLTLAVPEGCEARHQFHAQEETI